MTDISIEETQEQARQLLNSRIDSVTALVKARQRVTNLKAELAEAEKEDKKAYVRATKDGWSAEELKKLGLENGTATRRRSNRRTWAASAQQITTGTDSSSKDMLEE